MNGNRVWLSPEWIDWHPDGSGYGLGDPADLRRAYDLWGHAQRRFEVAVTELDRVDVVTTLKRSVDQRLRTLNSIYDFKAMPAPSKPRDPLKLLESLGVVRPLMLARLIDIRNAVEHEDADPPDLAQCGDLCEFVWYFLRSTDRLVTVRLDHLSLRSSPESGSAWLEVTWGDSWVPRIRGWLEPHLVSVEGQSGWLEVKLASLVRADEFKTDGARGRSASDWYLVGEVRSTSAILRLAEVRLATTTV